MFRDIDSTQQPFGGAGNLTAQELFVMLHGPNKALDFPTSIFERVDAPPSLYCDMLDLVWDHRKAAKINGKAAFSTRFARDITPFLLTHATRNRPQYAWDEDEVLRARRYAWRAIRGALVRASPITSTRWRRNESDRWEGVAECIASIISFDRSVLDFVSRMTTLSEHACRWRALDTWAQALLMAHEDPEAIIGPIIIAQNAHLYEPLSYTPPINDTTTQRLRMSVDPLSGSTYLLLADDYDNGHLSAMTSAQGFDTVFPQVDYEGQYREYSYLSTLWPSKLSGQGNFVQRLQANNNDEEVEPLEASPDDIRFESDGNGGLELIIDCRPRSEMQDELYKYVSSRNAEEKDQATETGPGLVHSAAKLGYQFLSSIV
jgi:hypothetical protein